jgi:hypothetical protein
MDLSAVRNNLTADGAGTPVASHQRRVTVALRCASLPGNLRRDGGMAGIVIYYIPELDD